MYTRLSLQTTYVHPQLLAGTEVMFLPDGKCDYFGVLTTLRSKNPRVPQALSFKFLLTTRTHSLITMRFITAVLLAVTASAVPALGASIGSAGLARRDGDGFDSNPGLVSSSGGINRRHSSSNDGVTGQNFDVSTVKAVVRRQESPNNGSIGQSPNNGEAVQSPNDPNSVQGVGNLPRQESSNNDTTGQSPNDPSSVQGVGNDPSSVQGVGRRQESSNNDTTGQSPNDSSVQGVGSDPSSVQGVGRRQESSNNDTTGQSPNEPSSVQGVGRR
ncbi:hypothetical protein EIP91_008420 [Steccherinum ochraceum]|uniref:Uncharacterized protein n=1 Tax=Steccherinum ochraceum TaxID=92696 RepID=A0A4R0R2V9_9APHY|nr:hypothetical protein EIP91_008420 [Steccherinum ochraceum]